MTNEEIMKHLYAIKQYVEGVYNIVKAQARKEELDKEMALQEEMEKNANKLEDLTRQVRELKEEQEEQKEKEEKDQKVDDFLSDAPLTPFDKSLSDSQDAPIVDEPPKEEVMDGASHKVTFLELMSRGKSEKNEPEKKSRKSKK